MSDILQVTILICLLYVLLFFVLYSFVFVFYPRGASDARVLAVIVCLCVCISVTVPRTHNRFGDRSFVVAGPRLWNSLPISLRQISSFGEFRRYLKNHLFGI